MPTFVHDAMLLLKRCEVADIQFPADVPPIPEPLRNRNVVSPRVLDVTTFLGRFENDDFLRTVSSRTHGFGKRPYLFPYAAFLTSQMSRTDSARPLVFQLGFTVGAFQINVNRQLRPPVIQRKPAYSSN